jgi:hypothetical protein
MAFTLMAGLMIASMVAGAAATVHAAGEARKRENTLKDAILRRNLGIEDWKSYWGDMAVDPTSHPDWSGFKQTVEEQSGATRGTLADILRKRGISGGQQTKVTTDVQKSTEKSLAQTLAGIKSSAIQNVQGLDLSREDPYFQGGAGAGGTTLGGMDFSGLGSYAGLEDLLKKRDGTSDKPPGGFSSMNSGGGTVDLGQLLSLGSEFDWMNKDHTTSLAGGFGYGQ